MIKADGRCMNRFCMSTYTHRTDFLDPHHIIFTAQGGPDTVENGIAMCRICHDFAHEGYNDPNKGRITGRQYMIRVLEDWSGSSRFRWEEAYEELRRLEGK